MYQSLKTDVASQILEKTKKTFDTARKKAVDSYLKAMKGNNVETFEDFQRCHNCNYKTAMSRINEIKISGAKDIQENNELKLKNVMFIHIIKIKI